MREYLNIFSGLDFGRGNAHKSIPADYIYIFFFKSTQWMSYFIWGFYFFCPYASHLMSYPSEIRCGIPARTVLTIYEFSENSQWEDLCSSCGCEWDHIYVFTMKLYATFEAKNARVMSVYCVTEHTICNLVADISQKQTLGSKFLTQALPYIVSAHSKETICT